MNVFNVPKNDPFFSEDFFAKISDMGNSWPNSDQFGINIVDKSGNFIDANKFAITAKTNRLQTIFYCYETKSYAGTIPVGHYDRSSKKFSSYIGEGTTWNDFLGDVNNWHHGCPSTLDPLATFPATPIMGIPRRDLVDIVSKIPQTQNVHTITTTLLSSVIPEKNKQLSTRENDVLKQIVDDLQKLRQKKNDTIVFIAPITIGGKKAISVNLDKTEFVVGYKGGVPLVPYVLGGIDRLKKKTFSRIVERSDKDR